ncbi:MAG: hypothetical protein ABIF10_02620 [Candidatus Woesearchaeota archaeon]
MMQNRIEELRRQIRVLEWDRERNQLNIAKIVYLNKLKEELSNLEQGPAELLVNEV